MSIIFDGFLQSTLQVHDNPKAVLRVREVWLAGDDPAEAAFGANKVSVLFVFGAEPVAGFVKLAMIEVDRRLRAEGFRSRMVLQVHDELVFESPAEEVERLSAMAAEAMGGVAKLKVPLEVSVASGPNWAAAK